MKLTKKDFQVVKDGERFQYLKAKMPDGGEICIEPCMNGFCVARYTESLVLIGEKVCTNLKDLQKVGIDQAIDRAVVEANKLL